MEWRSSISSYTIIYHHIPSYKKRFYMIFCVPGALNMQHITLTFNIKYFYFFLYLINILNNKYIFFSCGHSQWHRVIYILNLCNKKQVVIKIMETGIIRNLLMNGFPVSYCQKSFTEYEKYSFTTLVEFINMFGDLSLCVWWKILNLPDIQWTENHWRVSAGSFTSAPAMVLSVSRWIISKVMTFYKVQ